MLSLFANLWSLVLSPSWVLWSPSALLPALDPHKTLTMPTVSHVPRACCRAVPVTAAQEGPNSPKMSCWGEGASDQRLQQVREAASTAGQDPGQGQH